MRFRLFPSGRWVGAKLKFVLLPLSFHRLGREPPQCLIVRTLRAGRFRSMPATNSGMLIGLAKNVSAGPIGGKGCFGTT